MKLDEVLSTIDRISGYKDDWDGDGSPEITAEAVAAARVAALRFSPLPNHIEPTNNGGLKFQWNNKYVEVEYEILGDGSVEFLVWPLGLNDTLAGTVQAYKHAIEASEVIAKRREAARKAAMIGDPRAI